MEAQQGLFNFAKYNQLIKRGSVGRGDYIHHKEFDQLTDANIYPLLSNIHNYNIIFPKKTKNFNSKMIAFNKSIQRILKLANVDEADLFSYIVFYLNEINLEAVGENKDLYIFINILE